MTIILRRLGLILFIMSILLLLASVTDITGAFAGITTTSFSFSPGLGLILLLLSLLLLAAGETLEEKLSRRRILPKKEMAHLSPRERTFRRKLVNLFDRQKDVDPKKIAYLLPRYEKVKDTGEFVPGHQYRVYKGKVGNKEEYFTVDIKELMKVELGKEEFRLPAHIDIQRRLGKNRYIKVRREEINWKYLTRDSADILDYFSRLKVK